MTDAVILDFQAVPLWLIKLQPSARTALMLYKVPDSHSEVFLECHINDGILSAEMYTLKPGGGTVTEDVELERLDRLEPRAKRFVQDNFRDYDRLSARDKLRMQMGWMGGELERLQDRLITAVGHPFILDEEAEGPRWDLDSLQAILDDIRDAQIMQEAFEAALDCL